MKKIFLFLLLGIFLINFGNAGLVDDIVSYYKLDDNLATTNVIDSLDLNNGTLGGGDNTEDISTTGIINLSLDLDGTNDYINANQNINANGVAFTFAAWVNLDDFGSNTAIFSTDISNVVPRGFQLLISPTGQLSIFDGTTSFFSSAGLFTSGSFHFVVYIVNESNSKVYLDGDSVLNASANFGNTNKALVIGQRSVSAPANFLNGKIDEVGIWNRTLSQAEVQQLYNNGDGLTYPFIQDIQITLDSPVDNAIVSSNVTFTSTIVPLSGFNLTNATLFVWDSNGNIFTSETNNITGNVSNTTNFIVTNLTSDIYEWNVFGSSVNGTGFLSVNFSKNNNTFTWVPFIIDSETFNTDVFETSRQEFELNITTLPSVLSVDAILNYNGTRFTAETSCSAGLCQISTAIDIPLVLSGENQNKSFLWEISIFDGTSSFSINLTEDEQNVTRLHLEKCNATFTVQTLNFTTFDETTEVAINPFMFDGTFDFWLGTGTVRRNNSISESSVSSLQLCFTPSEETLLLDGTIEYDEATGTNYTTRNYLFQNDTINNVSQDIKLGLLLSEDSTSFILKVQDRDILPVANVLIFTQRFYPGDGVFKTVQVSETDDSGRTVGFFKTETIDYRFILKQNGTTVLTTNKQKIVGESVPFTLTFTIGQDEGAAWEPFEDVNDLTSDLDFNKTSSIVSFTYADTSGDFSLGRLVVEKVNASGLQNTIICSKTSTESSAIITCNLTGNSTGQYIMKGIITRDSDPFLQEQEPFAIEDFSTISGRLGLFLGWFIILISVFAFKFNEVAGIILVNLAIIMVNLIGLIAFGYVFISAMIAISIIILVVLER